MIFLLVFLLSSARQQVASAATTTVSTATATASATTNTVPGQAPTTPPHLQGQHFRITVLQEDGFLDILEDPSNPGHVASYSGYLIDMIHAIAQETRANFTFTLLPPSGYGSLCVPRLALPSSFNETTTGTTMSHDSMAYNATYRTQYNCGASDVNDWPLVTDVSTDMYLGMYYVTPTRQLLNQFTIPFLPPYSGTLAMFGTATEVPNFETLVQLQQAGLQPAACAPGGSALIDQVTKSFPGLQTKGIFGTETDILQAFADGTCEIYINDGPIASQFVLRRLQRGECIINGKVRIYICCSTICRTTLLLRGGRHTTRL
jgi:hypothetical protein